MRSKGIDWYDRESLRKAAAFCDLLLFSFGIKIAADVANAYDNGTIDFCSECNRHNEYCLCYYPF